MHPLVQSAIDAANRGENNKALELCKQALAANPNDVDAWLVVAAVVDQPERKRQCLNRVLALDPTNQIARDELLDMDRAAMGDTPPPDQESDSPSPQAEPIYQLTDSPAYPTGMSDLESGSASEPAYQPSFSSDYPASTSDVESEPVSESTYPAPATYSDYPTSTSALESAPAPEPPVPIAPQAPAKAAARPPSKARAKKPLVFRYPLVIRVFPYFFMIVVGGGGLYVMTRNFLPGLGFLGFSFLGIFMIAGGSSKVEINEAGIRVSGVLSSLAAKWSDIKSIESSGAYWSFYELRLVKNDGQVIKIAKQFSGYPRIVEILRQKRPDLFGIASPST